MKRERRLPEGSIVALVIIAAVCLYGLILCHAALWLIRGAM